MEAIEWLEKLLAERALTFVCVTHDRYFLENVCQEIIELDTAKLYRYARGIHIPKHPTLLSVQHPVPRRTVYAGTTTSTCVLEYRGSICLTLPNRPPSSWPVPYLIPIFFLTIFLRILPACVVLYSPVRPCARWLLAPPRRYPGSYERFLELKEERMNAEGAARDSARNKMRGELAWMRKQPKARQAKSKAREERFYELQAKVRTTHPSPSCSLSGGVGFLKSPIGYLYCSTFFGGSRLGRMREVLQWHDFWAAGPARSEVFVQEREQLF